MEFLGKARFYGRSPAGRRGSCLASLHLLQIEARLDGAAKSSSLCLLFILVLDFPEVKRNLIGRVHAAATPPGLERRNQKIVERDLHIVLLVFSRFAGRQHRRGNVLAGGAGEHQLWTGYAMKHRKVKVLHVHFTGAATTALGKTAALCGTPREGLDLDFAAVFRILAFAFDPVNF